MKKIYLLLGTLICTGGAIAQAPYSVGNGQYEFYSTEKHAPNAITYVDNRSAIHTDYDRATYYTENFDSGLDGWVNNIETGVVGFEITNFGPANDAGSTFHIPALLSSTPTNWILLDSDSDGTSGTEEKATLTSPIIDLGLSGGAPYPLKIEWEQFYAGWESDTLFLEISDDGGSTFTKIEVENNSVGRVGRPNPELVSINLTPYITDPTQVVIRFRWHGNWDYGWQLDNVTISDLPDHDITVSRVFRGDWVGDFVYSLVPADQAVEFIIGADIKNIGYEDITNIAFDWEILDPSMSVAASGTSTALPVLSNGENDTIWVSTGFTPTALGQYTINVTAVSDSVELASELTNNDATDDYYELTDWTYSADFGTATTPFYNWAGNEGNSASIGTLFNIISDGVIGGITAQFDDSDTIIDNLVYYGVHIWDGSSWSSSPLTITDDYITTSADVGEFVTLYFSSPVAVSAGDVVMGVAGHYGGIVGWEMAGGVPAGQTAGENISASGGYSSLANPTAPVVRLLMHDFTGVEENNANESFAVYPNPVNDALNVNMTLVNADNAVIYITDLSGKVVKTIPLGLVNGTKNLNINVEDLNSGTYFIEVTNETSKHIEKFVKY